MSAPAVAPTDQDADVGIVEALVAVTGIVDDVNDIIEPGAFARTLRERPHPKVCLEHDWHRPIGKTLDLKELLPGDPQLPKLAADGKPWPREAGALWARYQLNLASEDGRRAYAAARFYGPEESTHSIGYKTRKARRDGGQRRLQDLDLFEYSQVLLPAMRLATLQSVKADAVGPDEVKVRHVRNAAFWRRPVGAALGGRLGSATGVNSPAGEPTIGERGLTEAQVHQIRAAIAQLDDRALSDHEDDLVWREREHVNGGFPAAHLTEELEIVAAERARRARGKSLTSLDDSVHHSAVDLEAKTRYVRDAAYWGYPIGTPITGRMRPKGPAALALRQQGRPPSRSVGTTATKPPEGAKPPAADVATEHDARGLFPEPASPARVRAAHATGNVDVAVDNLVRELTDRGGKPDEAHPLLLQEGVTPAELADELRQSDQWPNRLGDDERGDLIASAVTDYQRVYAEHAQRQHQRREQAAQWQPVSAEEVERLTRDAETALEIGGSQGRPKLVEALAALGHDDPEGFAQHLDQVAEDDSLDAATSELDTFAATRREGAESDTTLPALPDLPETDNLDSISGEELASRLEAAQARVDGLKQRGERRDSEASWDARDALQALERESQRRAADQAERDRIEAQRRAENAATSTHVVPDSPVLAMSAADYAAARERADARRARERNVAREQTIADKQAQQRAHAEQLAETAPPVIDLDAFAERTPSAKKVEPVAGGRLLLEAGSSKNWKLVTAANMGLVNGGEFSPGPERSVETPKNPGKRALRDLADRLAAITDAQGCPAPWTAPRDDMAGDLNATWVQGWRDEQGRNLITASVDVFSQWASEHGLHYSRAERDYSRPDTVPGGAPDADGFRVRTIDELAPGDEIRIPGTDEIGTVASVNLETTKGDLESMWGEQTAKIPGAGDFMAERTYAGSATLTDGRTVGIAPVNLRPESTDGWLRSAAEMQQAGPRFNPRSATVAIRFAGDPDTPQARQDPGMGAIHPDQGPPGQRVEEFHDRFNSYEQPLPEGTRFAALASEEPSVWGRDERPTVGIAVGRVRWEAGNYFQTVRYDDGSYGQIRISALRDNDPAGTRHKSTQRYIQGPTDEQVAEIHREWHLGEPEPIPAESEPEPVAEPEPVPQAPTATIEPDLLDEAAALSDETLGITETEDGQLEASPEVADRQDRIAALLDAEQAGALNLGERSEPELTGTRADLAAELRLQDALRRRDATVRPIPTTRPPSTATAEAPKVRPGLAGAAQDHAEALQSGDQGEIARTRARLESSLRRSRAGSQTARDLADHVSAEAPNDADTVARLAEQLRADARTRRAASARKRREVRRFERERLQSLIGQIDAELRARAGGPTESGPGSTATAPTAPGPLSDAEYAAHTAQVESTLNAALAAGQATDRVHTVRGEGAVWLPDRAAQHKELLDALWARAASVPREHQAVIAGGLGGAGKSTVLRGPAHIDPAAYFTLNPDDIKEEMARRGMIPQVGDLSPMEASPLVHEESSYLANLLARRAYAEGVNVIWDITMSRQASVEKRIQELRGAGYDQVDAVFVDIPVETSVTRALSRHRRGLEKRRTGQGLGGRYVPPDLIRANASSTTSSANREVFDNLRDQFDDWVVYDNSAEGQPPRKIAGAGRWSDQPAGQLANRPDSANIGSVDTETNPWLGNYREALKTLPADQRRELVDTVNPARFKHYATARSTGADHADALRVARGEDANGPSLHASARQLERVAAEKLGVPTNLYGADLSNELDRRKATLARERKRTLATERHDSPDRQNRIDAARQRVVVTQALADLNNPNAKTPHLTDDPNKMTLSRLRSQIIALEGSDNALDRRRLAMLQKAWDRRVAAGERQAG
jgi:phage head maturation protease